MESFTIPLILIISVLAIYSFLVFFKFFKKYPLDFDLIAKFDEARKTTGELIYSTEQKMSSAHPDQLKQLDEIQKDFQTIINVAETIIDRNDRNSESSLKIYTANLKLIKTRVEILFGTYKIVANLNTCNKTLSETAEKMRQSTEKLKGINFPQTSLVLVKKLNTEPPKQKDHGSLHSVPNPENFQEITTPKKLGHLREVPPPSENSDDPERK